METIIGIYLAAGQSTRFGSNKLLMPINQKPLAWHAFHKAIKANMDKIIVVTGENDPLDWMPSHVSRQKWVHAHCADAAKGQSYSLACGLQHAMKFAAKAVVVFLADQPFITTEMLNHLIAVFQCSSTPSFVTATHRQISCPPVLLSRNLFPALLRLNKDSGARSIIRKRWNEGQAIPYDNPWLFFDVDTPDDYDKAVQYVGQ